MVKYYCDRCGREREKYELFAVTIILPEVWGFRDDLVQYKCGEFHFCTDCMKKINECIDELGRRK